MQLLNRDTASSAQIACEILQDQAREIYESAIIPLLNHLEQLSYCVETMAKEEDCRLRGDDDDEYTLFIDSWVIRDQRSERANIIEASIALYRTVATAILTADEFI